MTQFLPNQRMVHIAIGNSDDRLSQRRWAEFVDSVDHLVSDLSEAVHGSWVSGSTSPYQNAAWSVIVSPPARDELRARLVRIAGEFDQESVAWNDANTEFLRPDGGSDPLFSDDGHVDSTAPEGSTP